MKFSARGPQRQNSKWRNIHDKKLLRAFAAALEAEYVNLIHSLLCPLLQYVTHASVLLILLIGNLKRHTAETFEFNILLQGKLNWLLNFGYLISFIVS
jgi:hypothetical protein